MGKGVAVVVLAVAVILYWYFQSDGFDPESIRGKRVLITGTSSGIGEQLAYQYARLGASIVITARRFKELQEVAHRCKELGATYVHSVAADMTNPKDRIKVMQETEKHLGGLDHLVLNHGIQGRMWWTGAPENLTTLHQFLDVNFYSYVDLTSMALPMLMTSKGSVGVVSSLNGKVGFVAVSHYVTSKFALQGFFASLRQELTFKNTGVSVTLCVLGFIDTARTVDIVQAAFPKLNVRIFAAPADHTAMVIVKGVTAKMYEVVYPRSTVLLVNLHKVFPTFVEGLMSLHGD